MKSGSEDPIGAIAQDRSGTLWVGSDRAGLLRRRPRQTQLEYIPDTSGTIWSIREDLHGNVWVATKSHGLLRFSGESQVRFTTKCGLASNMVYETAQVANGNIWVATEEGLSRIRDGKCASLLAANGLPPGRVIAIASDARGTLWLKTVTAVVAVKITEADRVIDRGGMLVGARFLSGEDGFGEQYDIATMNSLCRHSSGEMWFATLLGVAKIDPAVLQEAVPPLNPRVNSISSDLGEHDLEKPIVLKPGDLHLRFSYSASSLIGANTREF